MKEFVQKRTGHGKSFFFFSISKTFEQRYNFRINILTHILKRYPQLIRGGEFTKLLQLLSEIQVESKDADMRYHLYECLIVLADVQEHIIGIFMDVTTVESLWAVIWESTLR